MADDISPPRRALKLKQYCEQYNIGRGQAYDQIRSGQLHSILVGRTRLIPVDAAEAMLNRPSDPLLHSHRTKHR
jgi:hypothetical protein